MSYYLSINANQRPTPFDVDENNRTMFTCNYECHARSPVADFEGEILTILSDAGLATRWSGATNTGDTVIGPAAVVPSGAGPFIQIIDTGGGPSDRTHNGDKYLHLSVQIIVRATDPRVARTRAEAIYDALDGKHGLTVTA